MGQRREALIYLDNYVNRMIPRHCLSDAYLLTCACSPLLAARLLASPRLLACAIASLACEMSRMLAAAGVPSQLAYEMSRPCACLLHHSHLFRDALRS
jgi:hypothetical protein